MKDSRLQKVSNLLEDDYRWLLRHIIGKTVCKVSCYTETIVSFEFDDHTLLNISNLEGELLFDIIISKSRLDKAISKKEIHLL